MLSSTRRVVARNTLVTIPVKMWALEMRRENLVILKISTPLEMIPETHSPNPPFANSVLPVCIFNVPPTVTMNECMNEWTNEWRNDNACMNKNWYNECMNRMIESKEWMIGSSAWTQELRAKKHKWHEEIKKRHVINWGSSCGRSISFLMFYFGVYLGFDSGFVKHFARVDLGLGQCFVSGWLKVGVRLYFK